MTHIWLCGSFPVMSLISGLYNIPDDRVYYIEDIVKKL